jgi:hypothetical protein
MSIGETTLNVHPIIQIDRRYGEHISDITVDAAGIANYLRTGGLSDAHIASFAIHFSAHSIPHGLDRGKSLAEVLGCTYSPEKDSITLLQPDAISNVAKFASNALHGSAMGTYGPIELDQDAINAHARVAQSGLRMSERHLNLGLLYGLEHRIRKNSWKGKHPHAYYQLQRTGGALLRLSQHARGQAADYYPLPGTEAEYAGVECSAAASRSDKAGIAFVTLTPAILPEDTLLQ